MESPDFYIGSYFDAADDNQHSHDSLNFHQNNNNHFTVDDLLDFSKGDDIITDSFCDDHSSLPSFHTSNSSSSSSSGNESHYINSFTDAPFSGNELFVPYNELPELEWISNFENESFSNDELQNFQFISSTAPPTDTSSSQSADEFRPKLASARNYSPIFGMDMSIPGKARSKRSRAPPCDWSSRIQLVNNSSSSKANNGTDPKTLPSKEMEDAAGESTARKCVHCGSVKTPQWRSGPAGPKTLCNACGVRHRSGRLVPEYRPAASPTFVPAKHSNSHRKVVELQRQKEMLVAQLLFTQRSIFSASSGCDYLIRGQSGTNFRQI